jgi:hypothetical protein
MYILNKLNLTKMAKATKNKNMVPVVQMTPGGRKLKKYSSIREAAASTGADPSNISKVTRGVYKTAGGFRWQTSK